MTLCQIWKIAHEYYSHKDDLASIYKHYQGIGYYVLDKKSVTEYHAIEKWQAPVCSAAIQFHWQKDADIFS